MTATKPVSRPGVPPFMQEGRRTVLDLPCHNPSVDPEWFFPNEGRTPTERAALAYQGKLLCRRCPRKAECLDWAVESFQEGVWGGTTDGDREKIRACRTGQCGHFVCKEQS